MTTHSLPSTATPAEGALTSVVVAGRTVALARSGGELYAFDDTCTHAGCSLSDGDVDGPHVQCPCHAGTFDLRTGAVVSGPPKLPVRTYRVREVGDAVERWPWSRCRDDRRRPGRGREPRRCHRRDHPA